MHPAANNMFTFPAIALGSYLGHTGIITDEMIMAAAETLPKLIKQEDLQRGIVYPRLEVSVAVGVVGVLP